MCLLLVARDKGNVLRSAYASEFIHLLDWVTSEVFLTIDGMQYSYHNICFHYRNECYENSHARFVADIFRRVDQVQLLRLLLI